MVIPRGTTRIRYISREGYVGPQNVVWNSCNVNSWVVRHSATAKQGEMR